MRARPHRWLRNVDNRGHDTPHAQIALFGAMGFWTDGRVLSCRVLDDTGRHRGFDIALRAGAL